MRDPARIPLVLEALRKAWEKSPDLRLGQLLVNVCPHVGHAPHVFYLEDDAWLEQLQKWAEPTPVAGLCYEPDEEP